MKGKCVVIEGLDGSGKGTLINILKNYLLSKGYSNDEILVTQEPSKSKFGVEVKKLLKEEKDPSSNATKFLDLYVRDREEHLRNEIVPALEKGKIVLCDRYKYSTIVYQSIQGIPKEDIIELHEEMLIPDLVLILDLPVDVALGRIGADEKREELEKFEKKEFLQKVRAAFKKLPTGLPEENIIIINASLPIEKVAEKAKEELNKLIVRG